MIRDRIASTVDDEDEDDDNPFASRGSRGTVGGRAAKGDRRFARRGHRGPFGGRAAKGDRGDSDDEPADDEDGLVNRIKKEATETKEAVEDAAENPQRTVADVTGVTDYMKSDRSRQRQQEAAEADSVAEGFDVAVATGTDFLLNHPGASVQDSTRSALQLATGAESDEKLAEQAQAVDEGVTERIDEAVEGTALDNRGTDVARKGADVLVGDAVRIGLGATTGIDTREGDTDYRTGAMELGEVALTAATAGTGRAVAGGARAALRSSDDAADLFRTARRGADDAAEGAARGGDDAAETTTQAADETPALPGRTQSGRWVGRSADDVFNARRGAGSHGTSGGRAGRGARAGEDAADARRSITDRVSDFVRGAGRSARRGARRAGQSRTARIGTAGTVLGAGLVGGGAVVSELSDSYSMDDGTTLIKTDTYPSTDRFDGGVLYRVAGEQGDTIGYTVVVGVRGRNVRMLDEQGNETTAPLSIEEMRNRSLDVGGGGD